DKTYVAEHDDCGSVEWVLQVYYGTIWDMGGAPGYGACGGNYYNCSCGYVGPYIKSPIESMQLQNDPSDPHGYYVWWNITDWNEPTYTSCNPEVLCNGQYGQKESGVTSYIDWREGYDYVWCQPL
ncbi:MAG: hypothetical protein KGL59_05535, partial [Acidobacteriota bacterium]|nr:hypothetical protein [Acidobacteriota bacterium]